MNEAAESWRNSFLAGLANYIDGGSIVAGAAALSLWVERYHLTNAFVGLLGAVSANALSAGVGALIGGRLCDRFGRKKIYQFDMLFYAAGMTWLALAVQPWMLVVGFILVGLAVGADIPASWSLIAENAPRGERGRHSGIAQVLWYLGPVVVLVLFYLLGGLGLMGARIVFGHLAGLGLMLAIARSKMKESAVWESAIQAEKSQSMVRRLQYSDLVRGKNLSSIAFLVGMYGLWNLWAGTNGFFFPYILRTVGAQTQSATVLLQAGSFFVAMLSVGCVFMPLADRVNHRKLFLISAVMQLFGMILIAVFPLTTWVAVAYLALTQFGAGFGAQSFFQLWSAELFPTLLRASAQGLSFSIVRISLGLWSFFVPVLTATDFRSLAWILTGFLAASSLIGLLWAPRNEDRLQDFVRSDHFVSD